jgi:hypothetical protein
MDFIASLGRLVAALRAFAAFTFVSGVANRVSTNIRFAA